MALFEGTTPGSWKQNLRDIRSVLSSGRASGRSFDRKYPATGMTIEEIRAECRAQGQVMMSGKRHLADWYDDYEAGRTAELPCRPRKTSSGRRKRRGTKKRRSKRKSSSSSRRRRATAGRRRSRSRSQSRSQSRSSRKLYGDPWMGYSRSSLGRHGVDPRLTGALVESSGLVDALTDDPDLIPLVMDHPQLAEFVAQSPYLIDAMSKQPDLIDQIVKGVDAPEPEKTAEEKKEADKSVLDSFLSSIGATKADVSNSEDQAVDALVDGGADLSAAAVQAAVSRGRASATPSFEFVI